MFLPSHWHETPAYSIACCWPWCLPCTLTFYKTNINLAWEVSLTLGGYPSLEVLNFCLRLANLSFLFQIYSWKTAFFLQSLKLKCKVIVLWPIIRCCDVT